MVPKRGDVKFALAIGDVEYLVGDEMYPRVDRGDNELRSLDMAPMHEPRRSSASGTIRTCAAEWTQGFE